MPADTQTLQTRIDRLKKMRSSGVLTIINADQERVTYRSLAELNGAIAADEADLAALQAGGSGRRTRRIVLTGRNGF